MVMPQGGFVRPERPVQVELADGKTATISIRLARTGAITGRILDDSGGPLPRARVSALRREALAGGLAYRPGRLRKHAVFATVSAGAAASAQLRALKAF